VWLPVGPHESLPGGQDKPRQQESARFEWLAKGVANGPSSPLVRYAGQHGKRDDNAERFGGPGTKPRSVHRRRLPQSAKDVRTIGSIAEGGVDERHE